MNWKKKIYGLTLSALLMMALPTTALAADYSFTTDTPRDYYRSTSYEDVYGSQYNYGSKNVVDYLISEAEYGVQSATMTGVMERTILPDLQQSVATGGGGYGVSGGSGPITVLVETGSTGSTITPATSTASTTPTVQQPAPSGTVAIPADGSRYIPKAGDRVRCDDGFIYEIKDVSRYDTNVFAEGPVGELPTPTCDWSAFPELELPKLEVRHFSDQYGDDLFIRNLYETRRMQYTIYNALGREPSAWKDGSPLASVALTIAPEDEPYTQTFWPWRASELEKLVHSRPNSRYYVEAWDYYSKGVFQYTRYCVASF